MRRSARAHPAPGLKLVEIHREDIESLPDLMTMLRNAPQRFIVFCDDLSFDAEDTSYKSLKTMLEGGIEGRPENVNSYATSNRRHMMAREMMENERSTAINPGEAAEEKVSLSDRFGLWLGFHGIGNSSDQGCRALGGHKPVRREPMVQVRAFEPLHRDVGNRIGPASIKHGHDRGVIEPGRDFGLLKKSRFNVLLPGGAGIPGGSPYGDIASQHRIRGRVDDSVGSAADLFTNQEPPNALWQAGRLCWWITNINC